MSPLLHFYKNFTIIGTVLVYTVIRNVEFMKPFTRKAAGLRQEERVMAVTENWNREMYFIFLRKYVKFPMVRAMWKKSVTIWPDLPEREDCAVYRMHGKM